MDFVTIDFETANDSRSSVCAIGLAKFRDGILVDSIETLIDPDDYFDPYNVAIHGITEDMVIGAPTFKVFYPQLNDFIKNEVVVAHYATFDMSVLRHACDEHGLEYPEFEYTCTYQISKQVWPDLINYKLKTLARKFDYNFQHHNALEDSLACAHVLVRAFEETGVITIEDLLGEAKLHIGRHYPGGYKPSKSKRTYSSLEVTTTNTEFDESHLFYDNQVVFTGTLKSMVRKDAAQKVVDLGGHFADSVTKKTSYLVIGDYDLTRFEEGFKSSKIKKAETLRLSGQDIELVGEMEFLKML